MPISKEDVHSLETQVLAIETVLDSIRAVATVLQQKRQPELDAHLATLAINMQDQSRKLAAAAVLVDQCNHFSGSFPW